MQTSWLGRCFAVLTLLVLAGCGGASENPATVPAEPVVMPPTMSTAEQQTRLLAIERNLAELNAALEETLRQRESDINRALLLSQQLRGEVLELRQGLGMPPRALLAAPEVGMEPGIPPVVVAPVAAPQADQPTGWFMRAMVRLIFVAILIGVGYLLLRIYMERFGDEESPAPDEDLPE